MTCGYSQTAEEVVGQGIFNEKELAEESERGEVNRTEAMVTCITNAEEKHTCGTTGGIVLVENIETVTLSADDLEPWMVVCHVGYIPTDGKC